MAPVSHRQPLEHYRERLTGLEARVLHNPGYIRGLARPFAEFGPAAEVDYVPSLSACLGWSATTNAFPLSRIAFQVPQLLVKGFANWMNEIVPTNRSLFDQLGITSALEIYAHVQIHGDYRNVIPLMSLWNQDSHTFIA